MNVFELLKKASLNLSNFNTSNVTNMKLLFAGCEMINK